MAGNSPYFETGTGTGAKIQLYHEDCISGLKSHIKPGSIDVIITSPPYNLGAKYSKYVDDLPEEEYLGWMDQVVQELKRVMHPKSSFFLNMVWNSNRKSVQPSSTIHREMEDIFMTIV